MTDKLALDLALVIPGLPDERDSCVGRLTDSLQAEGLEKAHVVQQDGRARLCLHYDPQNTSVTQVRAVTLAAGAQLGARYRHELARVEGMDCATCATVIEHSLGRLDGMLEASVSYAAETLRLEYDSEKVSRKAIAARMRAMGYALEQLHHEAPWHEEYRELIVSALAGVLLLAGWLVGWNEETRPWSVGLLAVSLATGGFYALRDAWQSIRARELDIDVLMIVAAAGAAALGQWAEGALLLFLFSLGHALEHVAMDRARHAIEALAALAPKTAFVVRDGAEMERPVQELLRGDIVLVRPGQRIPADGTVREGASSVDQAAITGESMPAEKAPGDAVFAGTVNGESLLRIEVTKLAHESSLARMVQLVAEAQTHKSPTQRLVNRFEKIFVPLVLAGVAALIVVPWLLGLPFAPAFYRAMAALVAASPCALAVATPSAVLAAVARAGRGGVLIKGGAHLENLRALKAIAFDKTGTITSGKPGVTDVVALEGDDAALLALAASLESGSGHPLAQAVVQAAHARGLEWPAASQVRAINGKGLQGVVDNRQVSVGNLRMFDGDALPERVTRHAQRLQTEGKTLMVVRSDGVFLGLLAFADTPRPGTAGVLRQLAALGVERTVMLTGDNAGVARAVADAVGIAEVRADLLPESKLAAMDELMREHGQVGMVGDGVNDAPAMARATVGIAMGGAGTDVALETADVALMADDLSRLPFAVALSRAAHAVILQNLWVALGTVALLVPATLGGWAGIGLAVLLHEGATVLVVLNALRLLSFADDTEKHAAGTSRVANV